MEQHAQPLTKAKNPLSQMKAATVPIYPTHRVNEWKSRGLEKWRN